MDNGYFMLSEDHHLAILPGLYKFYQNQEFVDVTLACNGAMLKAHAVVLSAGSQFFEKALSSKPSTIPMADISADVVALIIHFLYLGKVSVEANLIDSFLEAAQRLGIVGISQIRKEDLPSSQDVYNEEDVKKLIFGMEPQMNDAACLNIDYESMRAAEDQEAAQFLEIDEYSGKYEIADDDYFIHELAGESAIPKSLESDYSESLEIDYQEEKLKTECMYLV